MVKNIAILSAGILIGYLLLRRSEAVSAVVVKPGDKSKDIEGMQKAFEKLGNMKFEQYGQYDADTLAVVQYMMAGTGSLKNSDKGYVDAAIVMDLSKIYSNSLKT